MKKVTFNESQNKVYIAWSFAYEEARKGPWETVALDRYRFRRKIEQFDGILSPILQENHRAKIYHSISPQAHDAQYKEGGPEKSISQ